jgi:hypothetical protein
MIKPKHVPPLKQFHSDISLNKIQCKENLVLIERYDGSPACVKSETVPILIARNWTSSVPIIKAMPFASP